MASISVVIVNHNGRHHLESCLQSFGGQWPFEVIVVDNASSDDSVQWLKKEYPRVKVLASEKNLGFAGGNNLGIGHAKGEFVFVLNDDTELPRDFFKKLDPRLKEANERTGMFSLRVLFWHSSHVDTLGLRFGELGVCQDIKDEEDLGRLQGPCGAGAIYRRTTLESIKDEYGYFDERFFIYSEDMDLAWRARKKGWSCQYLPVELFHLHGGTTVGERGISDPFLYFSIRNRVLTFNKNSDRVWMRVPFLLVQVSIALKYAFMGRGGLALRAIRDGYQEKFVAPEEIFSFLS